MSYSLNESEPSIEVMKGEQILPLLDKIAELRIKYFAEYPYFYQGDLESEKKYLSMYLKKEDVIWTIAKQNDRVIGVVTGIPLKDAELNFKQPFIDNRMNINEVFYLGDILLCSEYRGKGLGAHLYDSFEQEVRSLGHYNKICLCEIPTKIDDQKRPSNYPPMDMFWSHRGYKRYEDMTVSSLWKNIGEEKESLHHMVISIKELYTHSISKIGFGQR